MKTKHSVIRRAGGGLGTGALLIIGATIDLDAQVNYTTLSMPGAQDTYAQGISGGDIVGYYKDWGGVDHGFIYNGSTYTTLNAPGASQTIAYGISGNYVVGVQNSTIGPNQDFLYNINSGSYSYLYGSLVAYGISGNKIVGYYYSGSDFSQVAHGFVYDTYSGAYDAFNIPGALNTYAEGVDGSDIVGYYQGAGGIDYGFIANSVPEPSDFGLLAAGAAAILAGRIRKLPLN